MQMFFFLAYLILGFVQLFAIMDGVSLFLGVTGFVSFFMALFVTYIPLLGSALGVYGATQVWDWDLLQALIIFFWYVPVMAVIFVVTVMSDN